MFCLYLCVYLGVYLCYGIFNEDIKITQSLLKGLVKDFLSLGTSKDYLKGYLRRI